MVALRAAWERLLDGVALALAEDGSWPGSAPAGSRYPQPDAAESVRVQALVELAQAGDAEAYGQLYDRYVTVVYRYVLVRGGDRHLAEDVTSETFMRGLRRIDSFRWQGRDIVAWFLTIARNILADLHKSARFRLEITTEDLLERREAAAASTPESEVLRRLQDERLVAALRTLTSDQAECVVLRFMEGLSLAECAEVLGRKENAVKQLQLRALRSLRRELERDG